MSAFFPPRHTAASLAQALASGLLTGDITLPRSDGHDDVATSYPSPHFPAIAVPSSASLGMVTAIALGQPIWLGFVLGFLPAFIVGGLVNARRA